MKAVQKPINLFLLLFSIFGAGQAGCQQVHNGRETQAGTQKETSPQSEQTKTPISMKTIIVDVRTPEEWQFDGHAPCSVNYPLGPVFESKIDSLKGYDKIIVVCRSGGRASSAKMMLEQAGIRNVENLGPWQNVSCN